MNASTLLQRQGWTPGQSLHPHKPHALRERLLVKHKNDGYGLGLGKNDSLTDQWWLHAYNNGLQAVGTGKRSALMDVAKHGAKRGGLWTRFVRGEGLRGTIVEEQRGEGQDREARRAEKVRIRAEKEGRVKQGKREGAASVAVASKAERRAKKEERARIRAERVERRARREEKRRRKEVQAQQQPRSDSADDETWAHGQAAQASVKAQTEAIVSVKRSKAGSRISSDSRTGSALVAATV